MSTTPLRILSDLYKAGHVLRDPGNAGIIRPNKDLQICEMTSGASGETRTLPRPTKAGIRFCLRMSVDGGGDITVTATGGFNVAGETQAIFADASDMLSLVSVTVTPPTGGTGGVYRWENLVDNIGTVIASASASRSPSTSPSASTSTSPSSSPSPSASVSNTPSSSPSPSASASNTPSSSPSAT